jgi:hypothetical protein
VKIKNQTFDSTTERLGSFIMKIHVFMKTIVTLFFVNALLVISAQGQGSFQNLDFEAATISQSQAPGSVNITDALPGWNVYRGYVLNIPPPQIGFNNATSAVPQVTLLGMNGVDETSIEGGFSVFLEGLYVPSIEGGPPLGDSSINQTGLVPAGTQSILFKAQPGTDSLLMSLDGQNIPFVALATGANYILYGGDISALANQFSQPLELEFTAEGMGTGWNLDSIEFSSQQVPEPSMWALLIVGSGLLIFFRRRRWLKI